MITTLNDNLNYSFKKLQTYFDNLDKPYDIELEYINGVFNENFLINIFFKINIDEFIKNVGRNSINYYKKDEVFIAFGEKFQTIEEIIDYLINNIDFIYINHLTMYYFGFISNTIKNDNHINDVIFKLIDEYYFTIFIIFLPEKYRSKYEYLIDAKKFDLI